MSDIDDENHWQHLRSLLWKTKKMGFSSLRHAVINGLGLTSLKAVRVIIWVFMVHPQGDAHYISGSGTEGTHSCWKYWFFSGLIEHVMVDEISQGASMELREFGNPGLTFGKHLTPKERGTMKAFQKEEWARSESQEEYCPGSQERRMLSDVRGDQGEVTGSQTQVVTWGSLKEQF